MGRETCFPGENDDDLLDEHIESRKVSAMLPIFMFARPLLRTAGKAWKNDSFPGSSIRQLWTTQVMNEESLPEFFASRSGVCFFSNLIFRLRFVEYGTSVVFSTFEMTNYTLPAFSE